MTFDPTSVEVTCVTLPKDHCVQVPWENINICGYSDQFGKLPHTYTSGLSNLRPTGRMRAARQFCAAREVIHFHMFTEIMK